MDSVRPTITSVVPYESHRSTLVPTRSFQWLLGCVVHANKSHSHSPCHQLHAAVKFPQPVECRLYRRPEVASFRWKSEAGVVQLSQTYVCRYPSIQTVNARSTIILLTSVIYERINDSSVTLPLPLTRKPPWQERTLC
jgi:hypothetical protein